MTPIPRSKDEHGYYHALLVDGQCKHLLDNGEACGAAFSGPRVQKYCKAHQLVQKKAKSLRSNKRWRAIKRITRKAKKRNEKAAN